MAVIPLLKPILVGEGELIVPGAPMFPLVLAAVVFALSMSFLKNPVFFALGVVKPPSPPMLSGRL
jgi:hypothetical protein